MLWACLRLPSLAIDAVLRQRDESTKQQPFALIDGPPQRRVLAALNDAALALGLMPGQSLAAAQAICPSLHAEPIDPRHAERSRRLLAAWAYRFSPLVAIEPFDDAVLFEAEGSFNLFGPWLRFAGRLHAELDALGFQHHLVLAPNPHAAHALAAAHADLAVTTPDAQQRALSALPMQSAGLDPRAATRLQRMGLRSLGRLFELPRDALAKRFGPALLDRLDELRGTAPALLPMYRPPDRFEAQIELGFEVVRTEALLFPIRRLVGDLAAFLSARDGGVQRFELRFRHEDHAPTILQLGLLAPERDPQRLFDLVRQRLERLRLAAPTLEIELHARELPAFVPEAGGLFDPRQAQQLSWPQLRERLRARLGGDAVRQLQPLSDHRPERAFQQRREERRQPVIQTTSPRPTWLLPRPILLRDPAPRILTGPERIESGWWDGGDTRRDYYVVETSRGQRAWVFCAVGEVGPFHLHGWFA